MSLESALVALIVLAFALRAFRQLFPSTFRLTAAGLRRVLGLAPAAAAAASVAPGCDSGCGRCGGCDRPAASGSPTQPLAFHAPPRR